MATPNMPGYDDVVAALEALNQAKLSPTHNYGTVGVGPQELDVATYRYATVTLGSTPATEFTLPSPEHGAEAHVMLTASGGPCVVTLPTGLKERQILGGLWDRQMEDGDVVLLIFYGLASEWQMEWRKVSSSAIAAIALALSNNLDTNGYKIYSQVGEFVEIDGDAGTIVHRPITPNAIWKSLIADRAIASTDNGYELHYSDSGTRALTLADGFSDGMQCFLSNTTGVITVTMSGSETINGGSLVTISESYSMHRLIRRNGNWELSNHA